MLVMLLVVPTKEPTLMAKKTPIKKNMKKVSVKVTTKLIKKVVKKPVKKVMKKPVKKVTKKITKKKIVTKNNSLTKVSPEYSNVTFDQVDQMKTNIIDYDTESQNTSFVDQIRANSKKDENKYPVVHMKCRRGYDRASHGQNCKSMRAYKLSVDGSNVVQFKCIDCGYSWSVGIGGAINI